MNTEEKHITSYQLYAWVLVILMVLTTVTITAPSLQLSAFTVLIALVIASTKAGIVLTYFMHLKIENPLLRGMVILVLGLYASVIILTFADYVYR
jgi:cytochrome c oxidase subunit IV